MRVVYFGSGAFGLPTLEHLAKRHTVVGVVTQPDKPAGRGGKLTPTPIAQWVSEHLPQIPMIKPPKSSDPLVVEQIRAWLADAWVVIAFGQKLSKALLADRFAINLHASLLPRWRGAAPINAAILGGDSVTGNSVITLADRMDAGLILGQTTRDITPLTTAGELHDLLAKDGPELVEQVLQQHAQGKLLPHGQDESLVTIATKLSRSDDNVEFRQKADFVRRQIHALTPWPGVTAAVVPSGFDSVAVKPESGSPQPIVLKVLRVQPIAGDHQEDPSTLVNTKDGIVACGQHTLLQLLEVQPPGKKPMAWADFVRGQGRSIAAGWKLVPAREIQPC